jgi:antitoxin component of MazEF toxin-antitoxin module
MTITTTQKVIKIGTSRGVTLPAKELRRLGVEEGDELCVTVKSVKKQSVDQEYKQFKQQYGDALRNLADR